MWKILVAFALFGALSIYVLLKGGDKVSLGGEDHSIVTSASEPAGAASAPTATPAANQPDASAAPAAASATPAAAQMSTSGTTVVGAPAAPAAK